MYPAFIPAKIIAQLSAQARLKPHHLIQHLHAEPIALAQTQQPFRINLALPLSLRCIPGAKIGPCFETRRL